MMRGAFIVVEGLDRAGKSTQVARLAEAIGAKAIKFPDRTTAIGVMINSYLQSKSQMDDRAVHLLFSANRWEARDMILETLASGTHIVCDRYAFSGIAYSAAKGLDYEWCRNPDVGLPAPDLTLFLGLSAEEAARRGGYGEERYEKEAMQIKVRELFARLSGDAQITGATRENHHAGTAATMARWVDIDAGQSIDKVAEQCRAEVDKALKLISNDRPLGKLFVD